MAESTAVPTPETVLLPKHHSFPPMWTIQPVLATRLQQFKRWSTTIQIYCKALKIWRLSIPDQLSSPLFSHSILGKALTLDEARMIVDWMASEEGGRRAEWVGEFLSGRSAGSSTRTAALIYWQRPEEWADAIFEWVEATGQRGSVVTIYEITHGETTAGKEFHGMDSEIMQKVLQVLVEQGKARIFGASKEQGVKFS